MHLDDLIKAAGAQTGRIRVAQRRLLDERQPAHVVERADVARCNAGVTAQSAIRFAALDGAGDLILETLEL